MNPYIQKVLVKKLKQNKKMIDDGYTDIIHITMGIETVEQLIDLLERSNNRSSLKDSPKPCPFCGCGHIDLFPNDNGYLIISCSQCEAKIETWSTLHEDAIAEWNKRA